MFNGIYPKRFFREMCGKGHPYKLGGSSIICNCNKIKDMSDEDVTLTNSILKAMHEATTDISNKFLYYDTELKAIQDATAALAQQSSCNHTEMIRKLEISISLLKQSQTFSFRNHFESKNIPTHAINIGEHRLKYMKEEFKIYLNAEGEIVNNEALNAALQTN